MGFIHNLFFEGKYRYYDTPDGKDCPQKLWYLAKVGAVFGVGAIAFPDMILANRPKNYQQAIGRAFYWFTPCVTTMLCFGSAVCILTKLRKEDDLLNTTISAALAGLIFSMKWPAMQANTRIGVVAGFAAAFTYKKYTVQQGQPLIQQLKHRQRAREPYTWKENYSIMKDVPRYPE